MKMQTESRFIETIVYAPLKESSEKVLININAISYIKENINEGTTWIVFNGDNSVDLESLESYSSFRNQLLDMTE